MKFPKVGYKPAKVTPYRYTNHDLARYLVDKKLFKNTKEASRSIDKHNEEITETVRRAQGLLYPKIRAKINAAAGKK